MIDTSLISLLFEFKLKIIKKGNMRPKGRRWGYLNTNR